MHSAWGLLVDSIFDSEGRRHMLDLLDDGLGTLDPKP